MDTKDKIIEILKEKFSIQKLEVVDDTLKHVGHKEAQKSQGGHFSIHIISQDFAGKTLLERHRMIHDALKKELGKQIHALGIKATAPTD